MKSLKNLTSVVFALTLACNTNKIDGYVKNPARFRIFNPKNGEMYYSDFVTPFQLEVGNVGHIDELVFSSTKLEGEDKMTTTRYSVEISRQRTINHQGKRYITSDYITGLEGQKGKLAISPFGRWRTKALLKAEKGKFYDEVTYEFRS